jgi:Tfp pilus assembly protein PilZ
MSEKQRAILLRQLEDEDGGYSVDRKSERDDSRKAYKKSIVFISRSDVYEGVCMDISSGGMFILTDEVFNLGQMVMLNIPFADGDKTVKVSAEIVRVTDDGFGVEFVKKTNSLSG